MILSYNDITDYSTSKGQAIESRVSESPALNFETHVCDIVEMSTFSFFFFFLRTKVWCAEGP